MSVQERVTRAPIWLRLVVSALVIAGLVLLGNALIAPLLERLAPSEPIDPGTMNLMIALALVLYIMLLAVPFVPGAEIGMILLTLGGAELAPLVYLATVLSLCLAFAIGRLVPEAVIARALAWVGLTRAAELSARFETLPPAGRARALRKILHVPGLPTVIRYRYVALALAMNLPGNVVIGGGGGIALTAGLSRLFSPGKFLLTTLIAVLPVPLLIVLYDKLWVV